jgi:hypothetical protein
MAGVYGRHSVCNNVTRLVPARVRQPILPGRRSSDQPRAATAVAVAVENRNGSGAARPSYRGGRRVGRIHRVMR